MRLNSRAKSQILELWIQRVCQALPIAREQDRTVLRDHIPAFLDKLGAVVDHDLSETERGELTDLSQTHGFSRAILPEYSITQTLEEYSILRRCVVEVLSAEGGLAPDIAQKIHGLIDEAVVQAATEFSEVRRTFAENLMEKLVQTNDDLRQFAAIAAHDLRAPLASIAGHIDFIRGESAKQSVEVEESFQFVSSAATRMLELIDKLLEYASLGNHQIYVQEVELNAVVGLAVANLQAMITETHAQVTQVPLPKVRGDQTLLVQLFQNLLSNSIKFRGDASPRIEIRLVDEDELRWTFTFSDNGIGFDAEQNQVIFEPFKRLHSASEFQGSGLGLSTCKRVVKLHGGLISASSAKGRGAVFTFTLSKLL